MKTTRKIWSMVLCVCLLLTMLCTMSCAAEQFGEELVPEAQGGFDGLTSGKEGYLGNWQIEGGGSIVLRNPEDASSEDEYLKLVSTSDIQAKATLSRTFFEGKIAPKKTYLVSFAYSSETANQAYIQMYEYAGSSSTGDSHRIDLPSTGGTWKETAFLFTTDASSAGTINSISFSLNCHNYYVGKNGTDTVLFDNISIREVSTAEQDVILRAVEGSETAEGYQANEAGKIVLQLMPLGWTSTDKAVVSGYVKAAEGEMVTVSAGATFAPDGAGKTFTGTGEWVPFSFSGIAYNCNITVVASDKAELKDITLEKDRNMLLDTIFSTLNTSTTSKVWYASSSTDVTQIKDGNCPVGSEYLQVSKSSNNWRYAQYTDFATFNAGDKYLCSFWYKSTTTAGAMILHKNSEADSPQIHLPQTDIWKKFEFVFEMFGTNGTVRMTLGIPQGSDYQGTAWFCAPSIEKLDGVKRNGFYAPCGSVQQFHSTSFNAQASSSHMQILGEPVQSAAGLDEVKAVYINGTTPSTGNVVMAAYTKDANNTKSLVGVTISDTLPTSGVAYPTATLDTSALATGTEIRAFVWNGISGLNPLEKTVTITK